MVAVTVANRILEIKALTTSPAPDAATLEANINAKKRKNDPASLRRPVIQYETMTNNVGDIT
jgi:hypothetical protein